MKDRISAGVISGTIGALSQLIYGFIIEGLNITNKSFEDFAKIFLMYKNYQGILAFIVGFITQILIGSILGIIFAYLIHYSSKRLYYLKGLGFGALFWLTFGVAGTIFKLPLFKDIHPIPALLTLIGALIFGFVNSYTLKLIDKKTNII